MTPRDYEPPSAVTGWTPKPVDVLGKIAAALIALVTAASVVATWHSWETHRLVRDYLAGDPGVVDADLDAIDEVGLVIGVILIPLFIAAGIVFIVWLWRARRNSEPLSSAQHRRSRGWVIGGWFCPIVNLWFPLQVVGDVWRASNPVTRGSLGDLGRVIGSKVLSWWWACFLVSWFVARYSARLSTRDDFTVDTLKQIAFADTVSTIGDVGAAVLIIIAMRQISRWQTPTAAPAGQVS